MILIFVLTIMTFTMTARYTLVLFGTYKDPILASFECYGEEKIFSPPIALLLWASAFIYVCLYWYFNPSFVFGIGLLVGIPIGAAHGILIEILRKHKDRLQQYPRWSYDLIQMTDREERRRIAYLWLSLPASTRMIYNTNNHHFHQWVEQVLLTVS